MSFNAPQIGEMADNVDGKGMTHAEAARGIHCQSQRLESISGKTKPSEVDLPKILPVSGGFFLFLSTIFRVIFLG